MENNSNFVIKHSQEKSLGSQTGHGVKQHHIDMQKGDVAPTVLIPGDPGRVEVFASLIDEATKVAEKREYITYTGTKDNIPISCTSTGLGTPPTAIGVEELIRIGAKNIIRIGTCGAIQDYLEPGQGCSCRNHSGKRQPDISAECGRLRLAYQCAQNGAGGH